MDAKITNSNENKANPVNYSTQGFTGDPLNIADLSKAAKFLGEVSYFRFVKYLRPMEADKTTHQFKPNSRFEDAVALYNFDIELRGLQQTIKDTRLSQSSLKYLARRYIYL